MPDERGSSRRSDPGATPPRASFATVYHRTMLTGLAVGAFGYVLKVRANDDLAAAIRAALKGDLHISPFPQLDPVDQE